MTPFRITVDDAQPHIVTFTLQGKTFQASRGQLRKRLHAAECCDFVSVNGASLDWQAIKDLLTRMDEAFDVRHEKLTDRAAQWEER